METNIDPDFQMFLTAYNAGVRFADPSKVKITRTTPGGLIQGWTLDYFKTRGKLTVDDKPMTPEEIDIMVNLIGFMRLKEKNGF